MGLTPIGDLESQQKQEIINSIVSYLKRCDIRMLNAVLGFMRNYF
jgi:hypothetical protein